MPDKTADALARILSLSSAQRHEERSHSLADGPDGPVAAPGPTEAKSEYSVAGREFSPGLMGSLFYDVFPDQGEEPLADARPRFGSKTSDQASEQAEDCNWNFHSHHILDSAGTEEQTVEHTVEHTDAHGPHTYGDPHSDPDGPADKDTAETPTPPLLQNDSQREAPVEYCGYYVQRSLPYAQTVHGQDYKGARHMYAQSRHEESHQDDHRDTSRDVFRGKMDAGLSRHVDSQYVSQHHVHSAAPLWHEQQLPMYQQHSNRPLPYYNSYAPVHESSEYATACNQQGHYISAGAEGNSNSGAHRGAPLSFLSTPTLPSFNSGHLGINSLPRECVVMLMQNALQRLPQESQVVERCMSILHPLTDDEYYRCFCISSQMGVTPAAAAHPQAIAKGGAPMGAATGANDGAAAGSVAGARVNSLNGKSAGLKPVVEESRGLELNKERQAAVLVDMALTSARGPTGGYLETAGPRKAGAAVAEAVVPKKETVELRRTDTGRVGGRTSILTEAQALEVFKQRPAIRSERASLCSELADRYRVTTTAIRHIWDRRTWVWTNMPYWTQAEMAASLAEGVCEMCRLNKINKIEDTCEHCPLNRKRGRPRGARDTYRRQRKTNCLEAPVSGGDSGGTLVDVGGRAGVDSAPSAPAVHL